MGADIKKENECFEKDYDKLYAKGSWNKDDLAMMKDLKKLMYYNLVIDAMENGEEYPGSEYMPEMSFRRGRNQRTGQFMSRDMSSRSYDGYGNMGYGGMGYGAGGNGGGNGGGGSGMYYPPYMDMNSYGGYGAGGSNGGGGNSGANNGGGGRGSGGWDNASGRRYYDSEKEKAIHKLHHMMENTDDAERKNALNIAIHELEGK